MEKWACVDKRSREALKGTNPHTVLEKEMQLLDLQEKDPPETFALRTNSRHVRSIFRGLAQFHGLSFKAVVAESDSDNRQANIVIGGEGSSSDEDGCEPEQGDSVPAGGNAVDDNVSGELNVDPLEITCTDVLLAMQEYRYTGLNEELLAYFVVTQIHGLEEEGRPIRENKG